jgi:hypothetical protein
VPGFKGSNKMIKSFRNISLETFDSIVIELLLTT